MQLFEELRQNYSREQYSAREAQALAHIYSWGPVVFQVARLLRKYGILRLISTVAQSCLPNVCWKPHSLCMWCSSIPIPTTTH
mgnify:CR=1 FL=1